MIYGFVTVKQTELPCESVYNSMSETTETGTELTKLAGRERERV